MNCAGCLVLRNYNFHTLDRDSAPAILSGDGNRLAATAERRCEVFERAVRVYIGHRFTIDDKCRAWLGVPADLHYVTMQLRGPDFQHHFLALALCRECKLERVARRADMLLRIRGHHVPEVIARIKPADIHRGSRQL